MIQKNPEEEELSEHKATDLEVEKKKEIRNIYEQKYKLLESEEFFTEKDIQELNLDDSSLLMDGLLNLNISNQKREAKEDKEISKIDFVNSLFNTKKQEEMELEKQDKLKNIEEYDDLSYINSPFNDEDNLNLNSKSLY